MVRISFYTVIARRSAFASEAALRALDGFVADDLVIWRCMSPDDVSLITKRLAKAGLVTGSAEESGDVAVVDMNHGLLAPCDWLSVKQTSLGLEAELSVERL